MQVLISFTLDIKKPMTPEELASYLNLNCPMIVEDSSLFNVSTERWDICYD